MKKISTNSPASGEFSSTFFDRIKRFVMDIGAFMDPKGYKKEIAQYESELRDR